MKGLSLIIQKIMSILNFIKSGLNFKLKVRGSKMKVPIEMSCHTEYIYEIPITYHSKYKFLKRGLNSWSGGTNRNLLL
jgi:predicted transcriptional regulator